MLRRNFRRWLAFAAPIFATTLAFTMPSNAAATAASWETVCNGTLTTTATRAQYCSSVESDTNYIGWTFLNLNHCPTGMMCAAMHRDSTAAWSWTGTSWSQTSLQQGWVYVYPYTGSWRWAWTQQSGWVAVSSSARFEFRYN